MIIAIKPIATSYHKPQW